MSPNPSEERVDVIDDQGKTIDTVTRREMRERRLPHRCVYLLVFHPRSDLFIHLRTPTKDVFPSHWDVAVGGVLAAGESFDAGVRREVLEEIGVEVQPELLFPFHYNDAATIAHGMVYRAVHAGPFQFQAEEVVRGEFLPLTEVMERTQREPFCPDGLAVLREYLRREAT